jgi:hypothetical protein
LSPIRSLAVAWWACKGTLRLGIDLSTWTPLVLLTILRAAALLLLVFFHRPELVGIGLPLVEWLGGAAATHYPAHLEAIPSMFTDLDALVLVVLGGICGGFAVRTFARRHGFEPEARPAAGLRTLNLAIVIAVLLIVEFGVDRLLDLVLPEAFHERGGRVGAALLIMRAGLLTVVGHYLLYAVAEAGLGAPFWRALRTSFRVAREEPIGSLALAAVWAAISLPFEALLGPVASGRLFDTPEGPAVIVATRLLVELVALHLLIGATTRIAIWKRTEVVI